MKKVGFFELNKAMNSTDDCKKELNNLVSNSKWKRLYKNNDLRCFANEKGEFATIGLNAEQKYCIWTNVNIQQEIKAIKDISKLYYTIDYGDVYYNINTKELHVTCSDCGFGYYETPPKISDEIFEDQTNFKEFNSHKETSFIKSVEWADEWLPASNDFVLVGKINILDL